MISGTLKQWNINSSDGVDFVQIEGVELQGLDR